MKVRVGSRMVTMFLIGSSESLFIAGVIFEGFRPFTWIGGATGATGAAAKIAAAICAIPCGRGSPPPGGGGGGGIPDMMSISL